MTMRLIAIIFLLATTALAVSSQRIGQSLILTDVYIPGGEAKPAPRKDRTPPLVVRLLDVKPAKDGFRYDFEIQGLDAGTHDLAKYLIPADPAVPPRFQEIPVEITAKLTEVALPEVIPAADTPAPGGYRRTMTAIGIVWFLGLISILLWKKKRNAILVGEEYSPGLVDRMKPLLDGAAAGTLNVEGRASLERLIIGHWRSQLPEIGTLSTAEAMVRLRTHPEAAPLVLELERWLHAKDAQVSAEELDQLLSPYR